MKLLFNLARTVLVSACFLSANASPEHDSAVEERQLQECPTGGPYGVGAVLGAGACVEDGSCFCTTASIGVGGCLGTNACSFAGGLVAANSCIGVNACQDALPTVSIGAASCLGDDSCYGASALIGAGSCVGPSPCNNSAGTIAAGSCNGEDPCRNLEDLATVGAGSCVGGGTNCHGLNSLVGALSCLGDDACQGATASIAAGSCTKKGTCINAAGVIGAGSCTGEGSCLNTKADFSSAAGSCTGKNSCIGASGTLAAGMCLTENACSVLTPAPTAAPVNTRTVPATAGGDPHFKTWKNIKYDYHGECDLVLIDNPMFYNGLGMRLHIRTTRINYYSYVETIALQIGSDTLEFNNDLDNYLINGKKAVGTGNTLGGFEIKRFSSAISVRLDNDPTSKAHIDFMPRKHGFPYVKPDGKATRLFEGSLGMLGEWSTGKMISRDGVTEISDATEFALEWQVRNTEPMLFASPRFPQFPATCTPPKKMLGKRLGDTFMKEAAEKACAAWKEDKEDCIFDVMATRSMDTAEPIDVLATEDFEVGQAGAF